MPNNTLLKAAELLREKGWTQSAYARNAEGAPLNEQAISLGKGSCFCTLGAIMASTKGVNQSYFKAVETLETYLSEQAGELYSIATWNDFSHRTAEEVIETLEKAAIK